MGLAWGGEPSLDCSARAADDVRAAHALAAPQNPNPNPDRTWAPLASPLPTPPSPMRGCGRKAALRVGYPSRSSRGHSQSETARPAAFVSATLPAALTSARAATSARATSPKPRADAAMSGVRRTWAERAPPRHRDPATPQPPRSVTFHGGDRDGPPVNTLGGAGPPVAASRSPPPQHPEERPSPRPPRPRSPPCAALAHGAGASPRGGGGGGGERSRAPPLPAALARPAPNTPSERCPGRIPTGRPGSGPASQGARPRSRPAGPPVHEPAGPAARRLPSPHRPPCSPPAAPHLIVPRALHVRSVGHHPPHSPEVAAVRRVPQAGAQPLHKRARAPGSGPPGPRGRARAARLRLV